MTTSELIDLILNVYENKPGDASNCETLTNLQKSNQAWEVCFEILNTAVERHYSMSVILFASMTLKRKIKKNLATLSKDNHEPLKRMIISSLMSFAEQKSIRSQLCAALVYLLVQSDQWDEPIVAVTSCLPDAPQKSVICVEYFTVLAEELTSIRDIRLKSARRDVLHDRLKEISSEANQFLWSLLSQADQDVKKVRQVLYCYSVWIDGDLFNETTLSLNCTGSNEKDGSNDKHCAPGEFHLVSFLIDRLVLLTETIKSNDCHCQNNDSSTEQAQLEDLHDSCTECMCSLLQMCGANLCENRNILVTMYKSIIQRFPSLLGSVNQWTEDVSKVVFNLLKILTALGYGLSNPLRLNLPDAELNNPIILQCILEYTKCKNVEVVDIMLSFWEEFVETTCSDESKQMDRFSYVFEVLIDRLLDLARIPADCLTAINHETEPELYRIRRCSQNIMYSIVCILGLSASFSRLYDELTVDDWTLVEASLHLMWGCALRLSELESSASNGHTESVEMRYVLTEFIFPMKECHPALSSCAIDLVNALSRWLCHRQDLLVSSLEFLFRFLPHRPYECSRAILAFCNADPSQLAHSLPIFLEATSSALTVQGIDLSQSTVNSLVKACAILVTHASQQSVQFDVGGIMSAFRQHLQPFLPTTEGSSDRDGNTKPANGTSKSDIKTTSYRSSSATSTKDGLASRLDKICCFFRTVSQSGSKGFSDKQLTRNMLNGFHSALFPTVIECLHHEEIDVVESACNVLRYVIRCSGADIGPLAPFIVGAIIKCFRLRQNSCLLYLASVLVDELGNEQSCVTSTGDGASCFDELITGSLLDDVLSLLNTSRAYRKNPDLVDDFFRLCKRFCQQRPGLFLQSRQAKLAFEMAVNYCNHEHPESLPSLFDFLTALVTNEWKLLERHSRSGTTVSAVSSKPTATPDAYSLVSSSAITPCSFLVNEDNNRQHLLYRMMKAIARDEMTSNTKRTYADFLSTMQSVLGSEVLFKSIEQALIQLIRDLQVNEDVTQQAGGLLSELVSRNEIEMSRKTTIAASVGCDGEDGDDLANTSLGDSSQTSGQGSKGGRTVSGADKFKSFLFQLEDVFC